MIQLGLTRYAILAVAGALSAFLVQRVIRLAVMDKPGHRSAHDRPTPKGGGIGVVAAFLLFLIPLRIAFGEPPVILPTVGLWTATMLLAWTSWMDDVHQFPPSTKLMAQCLTALLVAVTSTKLEEASSLASFGATCALSTLWLVFVTNAVNFMDGLNGLVSGAIMWMLLAVTLLAPTLGMASFVPVSLLLATTLAAFLPFNFPNARIFMGDVGSQSCGLIAGAATLAIARHAATPALMLIGPALMFGLLYDVVFTLIRRARAGDRLTEAHRGHLYQIAHRSGMPVPVVTFISWGFVGWGAFCSWRALEGMPITAMLCLLLAPQLVWTGYVIRRTQRQPVGRW